MPAFPSFALTVLFAIVALGGAPLAAQTARVVEVEGWGPTRSAARDNAVRNALTAVVSQFVVADRSVSAEEVLEDRVLSTMNGFVERFEILEVRVEGAETLIRARVTVSESDVRATLRQHGTGQAGQVDGTTLLAASSAELARREARERMVQRIVSQLYQSVEFTYDSISPTDDRRGFHVHFSYALAPDAVGSALAALKILASRDVSRCRPFYANAGWVGSCVDSPPLRAGQDGDLEMALRASVSARHTRPDEITSIYVSTRPDEHYGPERMAELPAGPDDRTFLFERPIRIPASAAGTLVLKLEREDGRSEMLRQPIAWGACGRYLYQLPECAPQSLPLVFLEGTGMWVLARPQRLRLTVPAESLAGVVRVSASAAW